MSVSRRLKATSVEFGLRTGSGRLFQAAGPAVAKARRPYVLSWCSRPRSYFCFRHFKTQFAIWYDPRNRLSSVFSAVRPTEQNSAGQKKTVINRHVFASRFQSSNNCFANRVTTQWTQHCRICCHSHSVGPRIYLQVTTAIGGWTPPMDSYSPRVHPQLVNLSVFVASTALLKWRSNTPYQKNSL